MPAQPPYLSFSHVAQLFKHAVCAGGPCTSCGLSGLSWSSNVSAAVDGGCTAARPLPGPRERSNSSDMMVKGTRNWSRITGKRLLFTRKGGTYVSAGDSMRRPPVSAAMIASDLAVMHMTRADSSGKQRIIDAKLMAWSA